MPRIARTAIAIDILIDIRIGNLRIGADNFPPGQNFTAGFKLVTTAFLLAYGSLQQGILRIGYCYVLFA